ncbi:MAG: GNAT family N-acetyltransferase [Bdellovibrionia bacterium]
MNGKQFSQRRLSLGFRTEMIFNRFDGIVLDRGDYLVVKTPSNPGFFFGNFLLFFEAPRLGTLEKWKKLFRKEFEDSPAINHYTFLWDSPTEGIGDVTELGMEGFRVDFSVVLTARSVHLPPKSNSQIEVRPISTDQEWREVIETQITSKASDYSEDSYRQFKEKQMARYKAMSEQGLGHWFGAFLDGKLVGDLGIYRDGQLGRFQSVETHPDYRRQGICGRLVYESAQFALEKMGLTELVMVADENYHAAKIYESVGFVPTAKEYSAFWWNKNPVSGLDN